MSDLIAFLLARLDDDAEILAGELEPYDAFSPSLVDRGEVLVGSARWLAEVEAKRAILDQYERAQRSRRDHLASAGAFLALHGVVKLLAQPFADHRDYDEAWRVG